MEEPVQQNYAAEGNGASASHSAPAQHKQEPARKETARRSRAQLDRLVQDIQTAISMHEKTSSDLQTIVNNRVRNLQALKESVGTLQTFLRSNGGVSPEHDNLLRNLSRDIGLNIRMTTSVVVAVNRAPALKNYKLITGE